MARPLLVLTALLTWFGGCGPGADEQVPTQEVRGAVDLLHVSYDPTREMFQDINAAFAAGLAPGQGGALTVRQSHGGSGKQARSVIDGLEADVVSLAVETDIDAIARAGRIDAGWRTELPNGSVPFTSTIVFVVRKGNPKGIRDWPDLERAGVQVVMPNPKTSGGARWIHLAAWGAALEAGETEDQARARVGRILRNVSVLDSGARGSSTTFMERGIGDVLLSWENEARTASSKFPGEAFEIVVPPTSVRAEPVVAVVDQVADRRGTSEIAKRYLQFLYTDEAQVIAARHHLRPLEAATATRAGVTFPSVRLFTVAERFGGWETAHRVHFAEGGEYDRLMLPGTSR